MRNDEGAERGWKTEGERPVADHDQGKPEVAHVAVQILTLKGKNRRLNPTLLSLGV